MLEFDILARGLYRRDQLAITYDPSLHISITPSVQQWMDTLWQQKLAIAHEKGTRLFDSQLFRLEQATASPDGILHLVLGNTSYKEYVTTREPDFAQWAQSLRVEQRARRLFRRRDQRWLHSIGQTTRA